MKKLRELNSKRIVATIVAVLVLVIGLTYAWFTYFNQVSVGDLIAGDVYLNLVEGLDSVSINNAFPETKEEARDNIGSNNVLTFKVNGKNTSSSDVFYEIYLNNGTDDPSKLRYNTRDLVFDLVEIDENNNETLVADAVSFEELNDTVIYSSMVNAGTNTEIERTYKLRVWISENVVISDTEVGASYPATGEERYGNRYANIKVTVKGEMGVVTGYISYRINDSVVKQPIYGGRENRINNKPSDTSTHAFTGWSTTNGGEVVYRYNDVVDRSVTLYPVYETINLMDTFPSAITNVKSKIKEIYFMKDTTENINSAYDAASIKADITSQRKGMVKTWLVEDSVDNTKYIMYVKSDGLTYFPSYCSNLFNYFTNLTKIEFNNINTSRVINMSQMFLRCSSLTSLDLSSFNTSSVTEMGSMFNGCSSLTSLDLSSFNTSSVTDMGSMFNSCSSLTSLDLSSFNTSSVTDMGSMFNSCSSLTSLDLSNFNTSGVTTMSGMFDHCTGLTSIDLSSFNTSSVTNMGSMFYSCSGLTSLDLSSFNTSSITNMAAMFKNCSGLTSLDLSSFNTSSVTGMNWMFQNCSNLTTIYVSNLWNVDGVTSSSAMFSGCTTALRGGNGTTWANANPADKTYAVIDTPAVGNNPAIPGYLTLKPNL